MARAPAASAAAALAAISALMNAVTRLMVPFRANFPRVGVRLPFPLM
jgi:hypothetical protein